MSIVCLSTSQEARENSETRPAQHVDCRLSKLNGQRGSHFCSSSSLRGSLFACAPNRAEEFLRCAAHSSRDARGSAVRLHRCWHHRTRLKPWARPSPMRQVAPPRAGGQWHSPQGVFQLACDLQYCRTQWQRRQRRATASWRHPPQRGGTPRGGLGRWRWRWRQDEPWRAEARRVRC